MLRSLIPLLMILVAVISLGAIALTAVPEYTTSTHFSTLLVTAINPEILLDYSYSTVSCSGIGSTGCYEQVSPYTTTEMWTGETTQTVPVPSTSTNYVSYAASGLPEASVIIVVLILLLLGGICLVARKRRIN